MARSSPPATWAIRSPSADAGDAAAWLNMVHRARKLLGRAGLSGPTTESLHAIVERPQEAPSSIKRLHPLAPGEEQRSGAPAPGDPHDVDLILEPLAEKRAAHRPTGESGRGRSSEAEQHHVADLLGALPAERQRRSCPVD